MREALRDSHPLIQLGVLILIGFGAMFVLMAVSMSVLFMAGLNVEAVLDPTEFGDPKSIGVFALKMLQIMQSIGLFFVPFLVFAVWIGGKRYKTAELKGRWGMLLVFCATMVAALPLINFLAEWNSSIHLPEALSGMEDWMRETEREAEQLIKTFLTMDTVSELAFNLFLIAFLPAVCEELFFRGMMQPLVLRTVRNYHLAIWLTAFLFSFFHMQFLGFFPRLLLGAVFGYAAHWSGTLALPMIGHFINNATAVLVTWYIGIDALNEEIETLGANEGDATFALMGSVVVLAGMASLYFSGRRAQKKAEVI